MRDWKKEIYEIHPNLVPLEDIKSGYEKYLMKCKVCSYEWKYAPYHLCRSKGCNKCTGKFERTHEEFKEFVKQNLPSVEILGVYTSGKKDIEWKCKHCGFIGFKKARIFLNKQGCKKCRMKKLGKELRLSKEEFKEKIFESVGDEYVFLEEYEKGVNKMNVIHKKCNRTFLVKASQFLVGSRCPYCNIENKGKNTEYHKKEIDIASNGEYQLIGEYKKSGRKSKYLHTNCGTEFYAASYPLLTKKTNCPSCHFSSIGEKNIENILISNNVNYVKQKTFDNLKFRKKLRFDFYLSDFNACVEYDGKQHFKAVDFFGGEESFRDTKKRDEIKNSFCEKNNIKLLRIPYYEKDIEQKIKRFIEEVQV